MLDRMGCIQMYISFVYIDTYAIPLLMLLSPGALKSFKPYLVITLERKNVQWKNIEKQVFCGPGI